MLCFPDNQLTDCPKQNGFILSMQSETEKKFGLVRGFSKWYTSNLSANIGEL